MELLLTGLCERKTLRHMGKRERRSISKRDVALEASFFQERRRHRRRQCRANKAPSPSMKTEPPMVGRLPSASAAF